MPRREPNAQLNIAAPDSLSVRIAGRVREQMFARFMQILAPQEKEQVLDVGVTSDQSYASSNYFETLYPWKAHVTAVGLDDAAFLERLFPGITFVMADATALPFPDASFELVHSSAVLEHVGAQPRQRQMLMECLRVARRGICLTTPNRWFPVEFHTQLPLLHWLPVGWYRPLLCRLGYDFFAQESNLNLVSRRDLLRLCEGVTGWHFKIVRQRLLGLTSNLLLFGWRC